jgi:hypothetical protein
VLKKVEELARRAEALDWLARMTNDAEREGSGEEDAGRAGSPSHTSPRRGEAWTTADGARRESKRLAKAVEALSGGRIASDDAKELAKTDYQLRREPEGKCEEQYATRLADRKLADVFKEDVERVGRRSGASSSSSSGDMYCLARDCAEG